MKDSNLNPTRDLTPDSVGAKTFVNLLLIGIIHMAKDQRRNRGPLSKMDKLTFSYLEQWIAYLQTDPEPPFVYIQEPT